jgi:ketosteroid isomerase-like protein
VANEKNQVKPAQNIPPESGAEPTPDPQVDEFFKKLNYDLRWPKPSPDAVAAAFHAIQRLGAESDSEHAATEGLGITEADVPGACGNCGQLNRAGNKFCGMCGSPILDAPTRLAEGLHDPSRTAGSARTANGQHHYHHHYHHHFFPAGSEMGRPDADVASRMAPVERTSKDLPGTRAPLGAPAMSRGEATIRKLTQDWALACNSKQLDDLVDLYATDALVLRSNVPPVRGNAAIREFFFAALDGGLGEVEMEGLRVELLGDVAYEAGRCKMLVPFAVGKRREERGKYLIIYTRQKNGEWKASADCWSSDLSLALASEPEATKGGTTPRASVPRRTS